MENSDCSESLSSLTCLEDATHFDDGDDEEQQEASYKPPQAYAPTEAEDEYIELLISKESSVERQSCRDESVETLDWLKRTRSDSVQWIIRMKSCFGFDPQTAYLAVSYLDRFLAHRVIEVGKDWALQLLSVACLSLAAKMEELRPPALPEFQTVDRQFDGVTIRRMELLVLNTLGWRLSSVTPFDYLDYFVAKLDGLEDLLYAATMFIFTTIEVTSPAGYRPSSIAAAAILAAIGQPLPKNIAEVRMRVISLHESLVIEDVIACYNLMIQRTQKRKVEASMVSSNHTIIGSSVDVTSATYFTASSYKRGRLL